jgi:hypothetical protein
VITHTNQIERTLIVNKIRVWRRLGVVLSVLWFIGFGGWMWWIWGGKDVRGESFWNGMQWCQTQRKVITSSTPDWLQDRIHGEANDCLDQNFKRHYQDSTPFDGKYHTETPWSPILLFDIASIALAWLLAWIIIRTARWVIAGAAT